MAHNLATTNGKPAMMFTGEVPWHQLGTRLDQPATAAEAIEAAGLNYRVELKDIQTVEGIPIHEGRAVVRTDTGVPLGIVGKSYSPIQNYEAFEFLDAVVADGELRYHTAGALGQGERIWFLAKLPKSIEVKGGIDLVDRFLLLSNTHDGTAALRTFFTPIRVVCQNTMSMALRQGRNQGVSILHRGDLVGKIREARRVLGLADKFYQDVAAKIEVLANRYLSAAELQSYFESLYPDPVDGSNSRAKKVRENLTRLFETGIGLDIPGISGTAWAAVNALTEYVDHHRPTRAVKPEERASRRLTSAWFGSGATLKGKAWSAALELAS